MKSFIKNLYKGRLDRLNYLWGSLIIGLGAAIITGILMMMGLLSSIKGIATMTDGAPLQAQIAFSGNFFVWLFILIVVGILVPLITTSFPVRRLHDLGKSGWYVLLLIIPLVNFFFQLYLLFAKGEAGDNTYGHAPKDKKPFFKEIFNLK